MVNDRTEPVATSSASRTQPTYLAYCERDKALAASPFGRDHWAILRTAQELQSRIREFRENYSEETPLRVWEDAGIPQSVRGGYVAIMDIVERTFKDMSGFEWGLNVFIGSMDPCGDEPDEDTEKASETAVVAAS